MATNSNRTFSAVFNTNHAAPAFQYAFDPSLVVTGGGGDSVTGGWRNVLTSDLGSAVSLSVSGLNLSVGAVSITGNPFIQVLNPIAVTGTHQVTVTNPLAITGAPNVTVINPVSVTGSVTIAGGTSNGTVAVTGAPVVTVLNPIAVTGLSVTTTSGPIAVTGGSIVATILNPISVTGLTVNTTSGPIAVTGGSITVSSVGGSVIVIDSTAWALLSGISGLLASNLTEPAAVTGAVSITNAVVAISGVVSATLNATSVAVTGGSIAVNNGVVPVSGVVTTQPVTKTATNNSTPSGGAAPWTSMSSLFTGQVLGANPNRVYFFVQNIHTGAPLYVNLGTQAATTGTFSFILNPSTVVGWGGSSFGDDHYRGAVCVSGGAWNVWEM